MLTAKNDHEVVKYINSIEEKVNKDGLYAAGFISYEAATAFDSALRTKKITTFLIIIFILIFF